MFEVDETTKCPKAHRCVPVFVLQCTNELTTPCRAPAFVKTAGCLSLRTNVPLPTIN